jgi:hypothetical protein
MLLTKYRYASYDPKNTIAGLVLLKETSLFS